MVTEPAGIAAEKKHRRSRPIFAASMFILTAAFVALGTWQVQRLFWKLDLIEKVDARVHAQPVPAPSQPDWTRLNAADDEYRRVTATGTFSHDRETLVQAVTERGPGYWVMTPLIRADGTTILINRGFVPPDRRDPASRPEADAASSLQVTGLLRMSEPGGAFLRANDPANDRWYSRDVAAIAATEDLARTAPYFIDAEAGQHRAGPDSLPVPGLTVVRFRNAHLVYAITWYALAVMAAAAAWAIHKKRI